MDDKDKYIEDLEKRLELQEEIFRKQTEEVLSGGIFSEYSSFPIEALCLVQPLKNQKVGKALACRRYCEDDNDDSVEQAIQLIIKYFDVKADDAVAIDRCKRDAYNLITTHCESKSFSFISGNGFEADNEIVGNVSRYNTEIIWTLYTTLLTASNEIFKDTKGSAGELFFCSVDYEKYFNRIEGYKNGDKMATLGRFTIYYAYDSKGLGDIIVSSKIINNSTTGGLVYCPVSDDKGILCPIEGWEKYYRVIKLV